MKAMNASKGLISFCLLSVWAHPIQGATGSDEPLVETGMTVSTPWNEKPENSDSFFLVMKKSINELSVRSFRDPNKVFKIYRAITGTNNGDKEREGDKRTPEGIYFIESQISQGRLQALHGAAAFELNYPNPVDRIHKRTGSGIWIHGVDNENRMQKKFDTLGCIAVSNSDILDLAQYITGFKKIPVVVVGESNPAQTVGFEIPGSPLYERVKAWAAAWSSREAESYLAFYHTDFRSRGMDYKGWRTYKTRLTKSYKSIDVQLQNLRVLKHGKYSVAVFDQIYRSDRYSSSTRKRLYWIGEGAEAQILAEEVAQELPPTNDPAQAAAL